MRFYDPAIRSMSLHKVHQVLGLNYNREIILTICILYQNCPQNMVKLNFTIFVVVY